jgi:hypothetical protein
MSLKRGRLAQEPYATLQYMYQAIKKCNRMKLYFYKLFMFPEYIRAPEVRVRFPALPEKNR